MKLLLIDDEGAAALPLRLLLERELRSLGVTVRHVASVEAGLIEMKAHNVELVLLDLGGVRRDRAEPEAALDCIKLFDCPVMAYSAHDDLQQAAIDAGAVGFISKSDPWEDRRDKLQRVVQDIASASVNNRVMRKSGVVMTTRKAAKFGLPALAAGVTIVVGLCTFFSGNVSGFWKSAKETGATEERLKTHFDQLDRDVAQIKKDAQVREDKDDAFRHRMDKNITMLLMKNGLTPARDGE